MIQLSINEINDFWVIQLETSGFMIQIYIHMHSERLLVSQSTQVSLV